MEVSVTSRNVIGSDFTWETNANASFNKNKIISLYGELDEEGNEIDDIANGWFIGQPIRVNYGYVWDGVWQLDEAEEAEIYKTQPGYLKIKDINGDSLINADDRQIIGQRDPKFLWGMSNTWTYKNLTLSIFMHGVHGVTKSNVLLSDNVYTGVRRNTTKKNWWTPDNPSNDWYMNKDGAAQEQGATASVFENAGFVRIKDITLSYNFATGALRNLGIDKLQVYLTGRNLLTITKGSIKNLNVVIRHLLKYIFVFLYEFIFWFVKISTHQLNFTMFNTSVIDLTICISYI